MCENSLLALITLLKLVANIEGVDGCDGISVFSLKVFASSQATAYFADAMVYTGSQLFVKKKKNASFLN